MASFYETPMVQSTQTVFATFKFTEIWTPDDLCHNRGAYNGSGAIPSKNLWYAEKRYVVIFQSDGTLVFLEDLFFTIVDFNFIKAFKVYLTTRF